MAGHKEDYTGYFLAGLALTVLLVAGLTGYSLRENTRLAHAAESFTEERIHRGGDVYKNQCASCHGSEGEGGAGPALKNRSLLNNTLDSVFFSLIRSGVPGTNMPAWSVDFGGPLTDEDVRDVVAYIRAWEANALDLDVDAFIPDSSQGGALFSTTCAVCHGENGQGGDQAPRINDPARLAGLSDDWYRQVIRNGRPAKGMPTWGTVLSPDQIEHLVALIDAWRTGASVTPDFSITDLLANAIFALEGDDPESAVLHLERALKVANGAAVNVLRAAVDAIGAGDVHGAYDTLASLQADWPLGDPGAGVLNYSLNCAACHGVQGQGGIGEELQNNKFIDASTNAEMVQFLLEGRTGTVMTGFRDRLDEDQLADIVALLRLWQNIP